MKFAEWQRLGLSFGYALQGIKDATITQQNMRIHLTAVVAVVGLGLYLGLDRGDWLAIFSAVFLVIVTEMVNTAIEATIDLVAPGQEPLAALAKDAAAGAVLIAAIYALIVALLVFPRYFFN